MKAPIAQRDEDLLDFYRAIHDRTMTFMHDHRLFYVGDEVDTLGLHPLPPALTAASFRQ